MTDKKKDILEDVKEVDRKVRAKIVYNKIGEIKEWAREIAELKEKTQMMLEELGVEKEDIKRLIDYATNSPEAQLTDEDKKELRDEIKNDIFEGKKKVQEKVSDSYTFTSTSLAASSGTSDWVNGTTNAYYGTSGTSASVPAFNVK